MGLWGDAGVGVLEILYLGGGGRIWPGGRENGGFSGGGVPKMHACAPFLPGGW